MLCLCRGQLGQRGRLCGSACDSGGCPRRRATARRRRRAPRRGQRVCRPPWRQPSSDTKKPVDRHGNGRCHLPRHAVLVNEPQVAPADRIVARPAVGDGSQRTHMAGPGVATRVARTALVVSAAGLSALDRPGRLATRRVRRLGGSVTRTRFHIGPRCPAAAASGLAATRAAAAARRGASVATRVATIVVARVVSRVGLHHADQDLDRRQDAARRVTRSRAEAPARHTGGGVGSCVGIGGGCRGCSGSKHHHVGSSSGRSDLMISSVRRRNCPGNRPTAQPSPNGRRGSRQSPGGNRSPKHSWFYQTATGTASALSTNPSQTRTPVTKVATPNAPKR